MLGSALFALSCEQVPEPSVPPSDPLVVFRRTDNPPTLDPAYATRTFDGHLACLVHAGLMRTAPEGEILPELVRAWEKLDQGKKYRFELRGDLYFPSGRRLVSADVSYSFSRICRPETASPMAWVFEDFLGFREVLSGRDERLRGIVLIDDTHFEIELVEPSATLLARLCMPAARVVDREEVEKAKPSYGRNPRALGAWELAEWEDDSHLDFRPNAHYPDANSGLDRIRFRLVPKDFTAGALFEAGEVHVLDPLPESQSSRWKKNPFWNERIQDAPQYNVYYLGMNCERPPLDRVDVRRAIRDAIRVDEIREALYENLATTAYGPVPQGLVGHQKFFKWERTGPDQIREILKGIEVDLWFQEFDSTAALAMEAVQADLGKVGMRCRLRRIDRTTYTAWRREGRFDLFLADWWADFPDPDNFVATLFLSGSSANMSRFSDPEVDDLILRARRESNSSVRQRMYDQAVKRINSLVPVVFLWHRNHQALTQPWVTGYAPPRSFQGTLYLNLGVERAQSGRELVSER